MKCGEKRYSQQNFFNFCEIESYPSIIYSLIIRCFVVSRLENLQDEDCDLFISVLRVLVTDEKFNRSIASRRGNFKIVIIYFS